MSTLQAKSGKLYYSKVFIILFSESVVYNIPGPLHATVGTTVYFSWNSNLKIREVVWGIRKGKSANPQYIYVDETEVPVTNPSLDANLKNRVHYSGNLAAGRAWFSITDASVNDSHTYIALIREKGSRAQVPYYVQVIVTGKHMISARSPYHIILLHPKLTH